jgi:hypothetical protein
MSGIILIALDVQSLQVTGGAATGIHLIKQLQGKSLWFHGLIILLINGNTPCLPLHRPSILDDCNVHAVWSHNHESTVTPP